MGDLRPYYQDDRVVIYHGNCLEILPRLIGVDVALFDPPYSDYVHGNSRSGSAEGGGISREADFGFDSITPETMDLVARWCADKVLRWTGVFSDVESTGLWREALTLCGLDYVRTGAWVKAGATPQFTGDRPAVGYEAITFAHRPGRKRWNGGGSHAVWTVPVVRKGQEGEPRVHPTQKPEALMIELVRLFSDPGETIIDPFMGSGTTLSAAKRLGRRAIGIEAKEEHCRAAAERLSQEVLPMGDADPAAAGASQENLSW